jgi:hypothetical protein
MKVQNPVRVQLENGLTTTVTAAYAEAKGLTVVDERAVDLRGYALPASSQADQVQASIDADVESLKGQALTDALDAAGLPKSGSAADRRAALAAHRANAANLTPEPAPADPGTGESTEGTDQ